MHQSGLELGDEQASGISLDIWARATGGRVPEEMLKNELKRTRRDTQGTAQVLLADGVRLMAATAIRTGGRAVLARSGHREEGGNRQRLRGAEPGMAGDRAALPGGGATELCAVESQHFVVPCRGCGPPRAADRPLAAERSSPRPARVRPDSGDPRRHAARVSFL